MATDQDVRAERDADSIESSDEKRTRTAGSATFAQQQKLHKPPILLFFLPLVLVIIYAIFSR